MEEERGEALMERLDLEFYYGQEAEQFTFYRLPKALITDARFKDITNNSKLLYGLMLDRMSLSVEADGLMTKTVCISSIPLRISWKT